MSVFATFGRKRRTNSFLVPAAEKYYLNTIRCNFAFERN